MSTNNKIDIRELADLPNYKSEYTSQLEELAITNISELMDALADEDAMMEIKETLDIDSDDIALWKKELGMEKSSGKVAEEEVSTEIVELDSEDDEEYFYRVKKKPELDEETERLLALRNKMSNDRTIFRRQEWFRYSRLGEAWRRPRGLHSKMRQSIRYRPAAVSIGYRGPAKVRGLHPSGFQEVIVHNPEQLEDIDAKTQAVRVGSSVGFKKRLAIETKADEMGIRVLNRVG
mgnify:CR=1 FL=1